MYTLNAAIEHGRTGLWYGRLIEFIGTHARSQTRAKLFTSLKDEFAYHQRWLRMHDEPLSNSMSGEMHIKEEIAGINELGESGGEVALFRFDYQVVSSEQLETIFRYMVFNRQDLLELCKDLEDVDLKRVPFGKKRNIEDILHHICNAEEFYISRFGDATDKIYEGHLGLPVSEVDNLPVFSRLEAVRKACLRTLEEIVPRKECTEFQRADYTSYPEEKWTAYKVLRRFLEHEREHIYNIREYLDVPIRPKAI